MLHKGSLPLVSLFLSAVITTRPSGSEGQSRHRTSLESFSRPLPANLTHQVHGVSLLNYNSAAHISHGHRIQKVSNRRSYQAALKKIKETITSALTQKGAMNESTGDGQASHLPIVVPASNLQVRLSGNTIEPSEPSPTLEEHEQLLQDINAKLGKAVDLNKQLDAVVGGNGDGGEGPEEDPMQKAADDWLSSATAANEKFAELQKNLKNILDNLRSKHEEYKQVLRGDMAGMISGMERMDVQIDLDDLADDSAEEVSEEDAKEHERSPSSAKIESEEPTPSSGKTMEACMELPSAPVVDKQSLVAPMNPRAHCICGLGDRTTCNSKMRQLAHDEADGFSCYWEKPFGIKSKAQRKAAQKLCVAKWVAPSIGGHRGRGSY